MWGFFISHKTNFFTFIDMFYFERGHANTVVCTVSEKQTLANPYYLFVFSDDQTNITSACIAADISNFKERYNQFIITETDTPTPTNGEVTLSNSGFYHYTIYQQHSSTNLDPALAEGILEIGKAKVQANPITTPQFSIPTPEIKVFSE